MRALSAAALAAFLLASPVQAQECENPAAVVIQVMDAFPSAFLDEVIDGPTAQIVNHAYNAVEPVSEYKVDAIAVMRAPGFHTVLLIAYVGTCVVYKDQMPVEMYEQAKGRGA